MSSFQQVLPKGFHAFHPDVSLNFQMNRWWSWVGEDVMLAELFEAAPRIRDYRDWKREFTRLARGAEAVGRLAPAAYHWRSADFFMLPDDADRPHARHRFLELARGLHGLGPDDLHRVPYPPGGSQAWLTAIELKPPGAVKDTVLFFGGFDSYIEELLPALRYLGQAGLRVIAFEGPGQGSTLHEAGLTMTPDWHLPVAAVLDHFDVAEASAIGLSLGGCLVVRAAAREPRLRRVVAYDILTDFFEVNLRQAGPWLAALMRALVSAGAAPLVNAALRAAAGRRPVIAWGLVQGMHVTGTRSPYAFLEQVQRYRTDDVSAALAQDVLLLAGADDHFVPLHQLDDQQQGLTRARSVATRVFTAEESAASHCQAGNYQLALDVMLDWLRLARERE